MAQFRLLTPSALQIMPVLTLKTTSIITMTMVTARGVNDNLLVY